jgi:hypothetical protein
MTEPSYMAWLVTVPIGACDPDAATVRFVGAVTGATFTLECSTPIDDEGLPTDYPGRGVEDDWVTVVAFVDDAECLFPLDEAGNVCASAPASDELLEYLGFDSAAIRDGASKAAAAALKVQP